MNQAISPGITDASTSDVVKDNPAVSLSWTGARPLGSLLSLGAGLALWMTPVPAGLSLQVWHLFAIFIATIVGIISRPLPIGPVVLISIITILLTKTLTFEELFVSLDRPGIWMLVMSFFLANGLINTKLAERAAYMFMSLTGKRTLGLAYGIIMCEVLLAPFIPSLVARSSCIIFPIVLATAKSLSTGDESDKKKNKTAGFLLMCALHGSIISSAMYLTGMSGNPLAAGMSAELGAHITWGKWFASAIVPGTLSLLITPWMIYKIYPPDIKVLPDAQKIARQKLAEMGSVTLEAKIMMGIFALVLSLWLWGDSIGLDSTVTCFIGVALLLIFGIIKWNECLDTGHAWDTLFWLSTLISLGIQLKSLGFFNWFGSNMIGFVGNVPWYYGFAFVALVYFYSHYLFASNVAHVTAMFFAFAVTAVELGTPVFLACMILAFLSSMFGGLTHYGCGPAPVYFGAGYIDVKVWWKVGAACALVNFIIWGGIGSLWMKLIGFW